MFSTMSDSNCLESVQAHQDIAMNVPRRDLVHSLPKVYVTYTTNDAAYSHPTVRVFLPKCGVSSYSCHSIN